MKYFQIIIGLLTLLGFLYGISEDRKNFPWKLIALGILGQFVLGFLLLKVEFLQAALGSLNQVVVVLEGVTGKATSFMFGYLAGGQAPFDSVKPESEFIVAFRVLPLIMVVSAISALLYHWRILPRIISLIAKVLVRVFKLPAPLAFGSGASFFLGTIEAPLMIKPYLRKMRRHDLFALITCSMATISGSVMILYGSIVGKVMDNALSHMMAASLISLPAAILVSRAWMPHKAQNDETNVVTESPYHSSMEAIIQGTLEGLDMIIKITGIIIVLFALVYLCNHMLAVLPLETPLSVEKILGFIMAPFMWLIGIPWQESAVAGEIMGTKIVLNEFVAYLKLSGDQLLSSESRTILTYALCGFANFASVGIILGGMSAIVPERKSEIISLCTKSLVSGNLATLMTGAIVGILI